MAKRKLTDNEILQLIEYLKSGMAYFEICDLFNISESTVAAYAAGRFGRHLPQVVAYAASRHPMLNRRNRRRGMDKDKVCKIIQRLTAGEKPAALAREYNVAYTTIWNVATGRTWSDLECVQEYVREYGDQWRQELHHGLLSEDVAAIRERRKQGVKIADLAREYPISESMISRIANGTRRQNG